MLRAAKVGSAFEVIAMYAMANGACWMPASAQRAHGLNYFGLQNGPIQAPKPTFQPYNPFREREFFWRTPSDEFVHMKFNDFSCVN